MNTKKALITGSVAVTVLLIVVLSVFSFFTTEQIAVKTDLPDAEIFIDTLEQPQESRGKGSVSLRLPAGNYNIRITHGDKETRTAASLDLGKPVDLSLKLENTKQAHLFKDLAANDLFATNETAHFLTPGYNKLVTFDNKTGYIGELVDGEYLEATWLDSKQVILQSTTGVYRFFDGDTAKQLPYSVDQGSLSVAPDGRIFYINSDKILARKSVVGEVDYEVSHTALQPMLVAGSGGKLLFYDTVIGAETAGTQAKPQIYFGPDKNDKLSSALSNMIIGGAAWSEDGKNLAISAADGLYVLNIEDESLVKLYNSNITHPETITWIKNNQLAFFLDKTLWRVSVGLPHAVWSKLTSTDESVNPVDKFAISPDGKRLIFSTATSLLSGKIFVVLLND